MYGKHDDYIHFKLSLTITRFNDISAVLGDGRYFIQPAQKLAVRHRIESHA